MDTQEVINLTGRAADSVLRFRTIAFTTRPVLDAKSFKAAIATQIRKVAKQDGHRFETPLTNVVSYAGMAASRAIQSWNKISEKENHIDREWFRNCVCDLVSGAVNELGQKAFQYNDLNASEYLEPEEYDPFDVNTYSTDRRSDSESTSSDVGLAYRYYGFARGAPSQTRVIDDDDAPESPGLPLHHEVNEGWRAIHGLAASHASNNSTSKFIEATLPLRRKRDSLSKDSSDTDDPDLQVAKRPTKRTRPSEPSPTPPAFPGVGPTAIGHAAVTRKKVNKTWTDEEVEILVNYREGGKDWTTIHSVLPRHTRAACQKKYSHVYNERKMNNLEMSVLSQDKGQMMDSPSSGSQGGAEDDIVE